MNKYGFNFWTVFLPFHILGLVGLFFVADYWITLLVMWFVIGVIGNGVAAHRYFAHGQFETWIPVRWCLAILSTLAAIGPLTYWIIQHKVHHLRSDKINDPHSPVYNNWFYVFYAWSFPQGNNQEDYLKERFAKRLAIEMQRDPFYVFFHKYHYHIIFAFCIMLLLIDPVLLTVYGLTYCIDFFRLGAVNYWCHRSGYRNHNTEDATTNNLIIGWLSMGFGWHNNHHASPGKLILQEQWWEIDIEGYIGWLLKKR